MLEIFQTSFPFADNPDNAEEHHEEFNPPPEGGYTGIQTQAKVEQVLDPANEREQVQTRFV